MKEEVKEIFNGILKKFWLNSIFGLGFSLLAFSIFYVHPLKDINLSNENPIFALMKVKPVIFWISFFVGFLWSNSLIKELNVISMRKLLYRLPIIIIWLIAMLMNG